MATLQDLQSWVPKYIAKVFTRMAGHKVTPDEWNDNWNLAVEQGDHNAIALKNLLDYLLSTVLSEDNSGDYIYYEGSTLNSIIATLIQTTNGHTSELEALALAHAALMQQVDINTEQLADVEHRIDQAVLQLIAQLENGEINLSKPIKDYIDQLLATKYLIGDGNISQYGFLTVDNLDTLGFLTENNITAFGYVDAAQVQNMIEGIDVYAPTIQSITNITEILYAEEGQVSRLTVDHLLTGNPLKGDAIINYIEAYEQYMRFGTAKRRDDLPQIQYTTQDGKLLYWLDSEQTTMTTLQTDPNHPGVRNPVMVYQYDVLYKMLFNFYLSSISGEYEPQMVLGAGTGTYNNGKAFIKKDTEGLRMEYFSKADGKLRYIKMTDDGIEINPALIKFVDTTNESQIIANSSTVCPNIGIGFETNTKVAFDLQLDMTSDQATTVTVAARVNGITHRVTTKHFSGAYKDSLCFNGLFDPIPSGLGTVDMTITSSAGNIIVAPTDYRLMLTVRNANVEEAIPYPEATVYDYWNISGSVVELMDSWSDQVLITEAKQSVGPVVEETWNISGSLSDILDSWNDNVESEVL